MYLPAAVRTSRHLSCLDMSAPGAGINDLPPAARPPPPAGGSPRRESSEDPAQKLRHLAPKRNFVLENVNVRILEIRDVEQDFTATCYYEFRVLNGAKDEAFFNNGKNSVEFKEDWNDRSDVTMMKNPKDTGDPDDPDPMIVPDGSDTPVKFSSTDYKLIVGRLRVQPVARRTRTHPLILSVAQPNVNWYLKKQLRVRGRRIT